MYTNFLNLGVEYVYCVLNVWWPWVNFFNEIFLIQSVLVIVCVYMLLYSSVYYTLLYVFVLFFLFGVSLSVFQLELFTAFLWLIECSVVFVFLLLLFYLNIKSIFVKTNVHLYNYLLLSLYFVYLISVMPNSGIHILDMSLYFLLDNSYEGVFNFLQNDLFVFFVSYYVINNVEFIFVGFLLLVGSVVCVNLYSVNRCVRLQNYNSFFNVFNFFLDMCGFIFLRKQNLIKQGNTKSSLKIFLKK